MNNFEWIGFFDLFFDQALALSEDEKFSVSKEDFDEFSEELGQ